MIAEQILRDMAITDMNIFEAVIKADMEDCYNQSLLTEEQKLLQGHVEDPKDNKSFIAKIKEFIKNFIEKLKKFFENAMENIEKMFVTAKGNAELLAKYNKLLIYVKQNAFCELYTDDADKFNVPVEYPINPDAIFDAYDKMSLDITNMDDESIKDELDEFITEKAVAKLLDGTIKDKVVTVEQYKKIIMAMSFINMTDDDRIDRVVIHDDPIKEMIRRMFGNIAPAFGYRIKSGDMVSMSNFIISGGKYAIDFKYKSKKEINRLNGVYNDNRRFDEEASRFKLNIQYRLFQQAASALTISYGAIISVIKETIAQSKAILNACLRASAYVFQNNSKNESFVPNDIDSYLIEAGYELDLSELY